MGEEGGKGGREVGRGEKASEGGREGGKERRVSALHKLLCMYSLYTLATCFLWCIEIREVPLPVSLTCKSV